ncbi:maleylpyruvate isomerase [Cryobacterium flavum]|uniref:Maleylpyruvate isomerase n=1 Tax=Cryobacterium flavum TaxID=1424659 RepID=A0A4R8V8J5_9MICO|nr:maleylpyruvate isomerase family mycothiol-dependent enzyme [Cryobacterium flavum]TFB77960.1 maleylpyruvate isomerase family mycothiol-dependent enzyme [Cryobacterium flavum]SDO23331.1 maleylpyruvate isomerase [Cryobacterium flavum]
MVARHDLTTNPLLQTQLLQARRGTAFFARKLNELSDAALDDASLLPGWNRRHILAHVGYNARAIARLVEWAHTEVETPMYESMDARTHEISYGATLSPIALRNLFDHSAVHLSVEWRDLPHEAWSRQVRTIQGREVPASETVWMRSREIWLHAVDLDNGASFRDIPTEILERLLGDVTGAWKTRGDDRDLVLQITQAQHVSQLGDLESTTPTIVSGTLAGIAEWATGRGTTRISSNNGTVPTAPRWI